MDKKSRLLFVILSVLASCIVPNSLLISGIPLVNESAIIRHGDYSLVAGFIYVRFTDANTETLAQAILPSGFFVESNFLNNSETNRRDDKGLEINSSTNKEFVSAVERLSRTFIIRYTAPLHPQSAAKVLSGVAGVEVSEPWYVPEVQSAPNDPYWIAQDGLRQMKIHEAWDIDQGNENIVIAISDNGVTQDHEDLKPSLWKNINEIPGNMADDDGNGFVDDYQGINFAWQQDGTAPGTTTNHSADGHGTKVSGLAGAATNNNIGIAGSAYKTKIFPMKTALNNKTSIVYGYQSLIYAADMGFKVANCSWGIPKPPSPIEQSVIDYCVAKGMVVVASAGNHGSAPNNSGWTLLNYPAAYDGVIGVGEVSSSDIMASTSGLGKNAIVMAPSTDAITTGSGGDYTTNNINGTSFAAPMGSGVVALIRSRYPQLSVRQVAALLRRTADDISSLNPSVSNIISPRINAQRALATDPSTIPALRIQSVERLFTNGKQADRFTTGDTLDFIYTIINDLSLVNNVTFNLKIADDGGWVVKVLQNTQFVSAVSQGQSINVGSFRVVVTSVSPLPCIFRLVFSAENYLDSSLDYFMPPSAMTTIENNQLAFSVGDDGTYGYGSSLSTRQGIGFVWKQGYNLISPSGFLFCENKTRVLKGFDNTNNQSEFSPLKTYTEPERNRSVMTDSAASAPRKVGISVEQKWLFTSNDAQSTVLRITIENISDSNLIDISAGYLLDWDIGYAGQDNKTKLAPEALPSAVPYLGEAQAFWRDGVPAVVICAAVSNENDILGQAAGFLLSQIVGNGITDQDVIQLLTSGTKVQTSDIGDACGVVGMMFPGNLAPGEKRTFRIVIGIASTFEQAAQIVRDDISNTSSVSGTRVLNFRVYPNPADRYLTLLYEEQAKSIDVFDIAGRMVLHIEVPPASFESMIDVSNLVQGIYQIRIQYAHTSSVIPAIVVH